MVFCFYLDPCRFEHLLGEVWILTKKSGWPGWLWAALWFFFGTSKYVFHIYLCSSQEIRTAEWTTSILQKARIRFVSFQHFLCVLLFVAKIISSAVVFTSFEETIHFVFLWSFNFCEKNDPERLVLKIFLVWRYYKTEETGQAVGVMSSTLASYLIAPCAEFNNLTLHMPRISFINIWLPSTDSHLCKRSPWHH